MNIQKGMTKALDRYKAGRWNGWVERRAMAEKAAASAIERFGPFPEQAPSRQVRRRLRRKG